MGEPSNLWAIGEQGTIAHWNGSEWSSLPSGVRSHLRSIWGFDRDNIWIVGDDGVILRWNGRYLENLPSGISKTFRAIWGSTPDDVWLAADDGLILHWKGGALSRIESGTTEDVQALWGSAPDDVWASAATVSSYYQKCGGESLHSALLHYNGHEWSRVASPVDNGIVSISGISASDIWAAGDHATLHWNGNDWKDVTPRESCQFIRIKALSGGHAWLAGCEFLYYWNGSDWEKHFEAGKKTSAFVANESAAFAARWNDSVARWDGSRWIDLTSTSLNRAIKIWQADSDLWLLGGSDIFRMFDNEWKVEVNTRNLLQGELPVDIDGTNAANVWIAGIRGSVVQLKGSQWIDHPGTGLQRAWQIRVQNQESVWALGIQDNSGIAARSIWNGESWSQQVAPEIPADIYMIMDGKKGDWWGIGQDGTGYHLVEGRWLALDNIHAIHAMWSTESGDVWLVGQNGMILRWSGEALTHVQSGTSAELWSIAGTQDNNIWAVGDSGVILHWNGQTWSAEESGTLERLFRIDVVHCKDRSVWALGDHNVVLTKQH